jgi:hypothetical protein
MKSLEVYDPPMCCSTGVCGTDIDPKLIQFASDLTWLKEQGISVQRYNLAQQPSAFAANPRVADALKTHGNACLPILLLDGAIVTRSIYPSRDQLALLSGISSCCGESAGGACGGDEPSDSCCGGEKNEPCCGGNDPKRSGCC